MFKPRIKTDYNWAIYSLAEELYNDIKKYVEYNGGFIDCQPALCSDNIYGYNCYGGERSDEVEEQFVYALKVDDGDLYACLVPCNTNYREKWEKSDYEITFNDRDNDIHWHYIGRDTDSVMFVPTIMNIAEFIEEYETLEKKNDDSAR